MTSTFMQALRARWQSADTLVCVGLDPEPAKFPARFAGDPDAVFAFCRDIADATAEFACAFKPQIAHFAALGAEHLGVRPLGALPFDARVAEACEVRDLLPRGRRRRHAETAAALWEQLDELHGLLAEDVASAAGTGWGRRA